MKKGMSLILMLMTSALMAAPGGYLGVMLEGLGHGSKSDPGEGVLINQVVPDSGADRAGLRVGDIIVQLNGKGVARVGDVTSALQAFESGDQVEVAYIREGDKLKATVVLSDNKVFQLAEPVNVRKWAYFVEDRPYLGVEFQPLSDQLAEYFGVNFGILVTAVVDDSPASKSGLHAGDVMTSVSGTELSNHHDFLKALGEFEPGDEVNLSIVRRGENLTIPVTLVKREHKQDARFQDESGNVFHFGPDQAFGLHSDSSKNAWAPRVPHFEHDNDGIRQEIKLLREEIEALRQELKKRH